MNGGGRIQLNRRWQSNFQSHSQHPFSFAPAPLRWPRHPLTVPERAQTDIPSATKALRRSLHPAAHQKPRARASGRSPIHGFSLRSFRLSYSVQGGQARIRSPLLRDTLRSCRKPGAASISITQLEDREFFLPAEAAGLSGNWVTGSTDWKWIDDMGMGLLIDIFCPTGWWMGSTRFLFFLFGAGPRRRPRGRSG